MTGTLNIGDLLIIVLIADASQNAMGAGYTSVTDGLILITVDELMSHLREEGVTDLKEVRIASMEGDGRISVVTHETNTTRPPDELVK